MLPCCKSKCLNIISSFYEKFSELAQALPNWHLYGKCYKMYVSYFILFLINRYKITLRHTLCNNKISENSLEFKDSNCLHVIILILSVVLALTSNTTYLVITSGVVHKSIVTYSVLLNFYKAYLFQIYSVIADDS